MEYDTNKNNDNPTSHNLAKLESLMQNETFGPCVQGAMLSNKDGHIKNHLGKIVVDELSNRTRLPTDLPKVLVHEHLTPAEENHLVDLYPDFKLQFTGKNVNSHAKLCAMRKLNELVLKKKIGYSALTLEQRSAVIKNNGVDVFTKDIGGNLGYHMANDDVDIHSCCPDLEVKDSMRHCERVVNAKYLAAKRGDLPDVGLTMQRSRANVLYGAMLFVPEVLMKISGKFPDIPVRWHHLDKKKQRINDDVGICDEAFLKRKSKHILFIFERDNSLNYSHPTPFYISYFITHKFFFKIKLSLAS